MMIDLSTIPIERWEKVKNNASPDDPELIAYGINAKPNRAKPIGQKVVNSTE